MLGRRDERAGEVCEEEQGAALQNRLAGAAAVGSAQMCFTITDKKQNKTKQNQAGKQTQHVPRIAFNEIRVEKEHRKRSLFRFH